MKDKKENNFFVNIESPDELRKTILETSKKTINLLRQMKAIQNIRIEKTETIKKLDDTMKEITKINTKLKSLLPKTTIRISEIKTKEKIQIPKKQSSEKKEQNIDKKLDYIEERLKNLGI